MSARRLRLLVCSAALTFALLPTTAAAHAAYKDSDPPDESSVASAPSEIWAEFTEPPAEGSTLSVFNECGDRVDLGNSRIDAFRLYIGVDSPHRGGFRVDFRVTSAYDSHVTTGSFTFTATSGEDCAAPPPGDGGEDGGGGGGGGDRGSAGPGTSSDDGEGSGEGFEEISSISEAGDDEGASTRERERERGRGVDRGTRGEGSDAEAEDSDRTVAEPVPAVPGVWDGIALRDLLIGYAFAMLIGAAGGKIYAGIVGPRR